MLQSPWYFDPALPHPGPGCWLFLLLEVFCLRSLKGSLHLKSSASVPQDLKYAERSQVTMLSFTLLIAPKNFSVVFIIHLSPWNRGSQLEAILPPRGHLAMSIDIFGISTRIRIKEDYWHLEEDTCKVSDILWCAEQSSTTKPRRSTVPWLRPQEWNGSPRGLTLSTNWCIPCAFSTNLNTVGPPSTFVNPLNYSCSWVSPMRTVCCHGQTMFTSLSICYL